MSKKTITKITVDFLMVEILLFLMAYMLTGQKVHEWLGTAVFALMIAHHFLNISWLKGLGKGRYTPYRILQTGIDLLVFLCMIGSMVSGIVMSRHVFPFVSIPGGLSFARSLHMLCAYWGFALMSCHLGMHGKMFRNMLCKAANIKEPSLIRTIVLRVIALLVAGYGVYAFLFHSIPSYMFLQVHFVLFDFARSPALFAVEYMAMMGLFAIIAYYMVELVQKINVKTQGKERVD